MSEKRKPSNNILAAPFIDNMNFFLYLLLPYIFVTIFWYYIGIIILNLPHFEVFVYTLGSYGLVIGFLLGITQPRRIEAGFGLFAGVFGFNINIPLAGYLFVTLVSSFVLFGLIKMFTVIIGFLGVPVSKSVVTTFDFLLVGELFVRGVRSNYSIIIYYLLPVVSFTIYSMYVFDMLNRSVFYLAIFLLASPVLFIAIPHPGIQQFGCILLGAMATIISPLGILFALSESFTNGRENKQDEEYPSTF